MPSDILDVLNMKPIQLDKRKISLNIFHKNEVTSFIDLSESERMELMGNLGKNQTMISQKISRNDKNIKELKDDRKTSINIQKALQKNILKYKELDKLKEDGEEYKNLYDDLNILKRKIELSKSLIEKMNTNSSLINKTACIQDIKIPKEEINLISLYQLTNQIKKNKQLIEKSTINENIIIPKSDKVLNIFNLIVKMQNLKIYPKIEVEYIPQEKNEIEIFKLIQQVEINQERINQNQISDVQKLENNDDKQYQVYKLINNFNQVDENINSFSKEIKNKVLNIEELNNKIGNIEICPLTGHSFAEKCKEYLKG
jgi:hypothetical protein